MILLQLLIQQSADIRDTALAVVQHAAYHTVHAGVKQYKFYMSHSIELLLSQDGIQVRCPNAEFKQQKFSSCTSKEYLKSKPRLQTDSSESMLVEHLGNTEKLLSMHQVLTSKCRISFSVFTYAV